MSQLIDVHKGGRIITASGVENTDLIKGFRRNTHEKSFEKIVRIMDEAVESIATKQGSISIPWACVGSLFGDRANVLGHGDVEYVWDKIIEIMGPDRFCRMTLGSILMWRVAHRAEETNEKWFATQTEYDELDPETGKPITRYEYFIGS